MNRFYFNNKNNPEKPCYEVYGIDVFTGIRFSLALCGTRKAAEKALEEYLFRIQPCDEYIPVHKYEGLLFVEKTTIEEYWQNREIEKTKRYGLRGSYVGEIIFINRHENEIINNIISCKEKIQSNLFHIGDDSKLDVLERKCSNISTYQVTKRYSDKRKKIIELVLDLHFQPKKHTYEHNKDIPGPKTIIQNQSAVIFKGTEEELMQTVNAPWFSDLCMSFFHQAVKSHYYGFKRTYYLHNTPVYKDYTRTTDEFHFCFMGFLIERGHYNYKPGRKKIWYD